MAPEVDVASAILSHVADLAATVIVRGAYGHSRVRKLVLGGVTVPVLMSR